MGSHHLDLLQPGAGCYIVVMRHKHTEWPHNQLSGAFGVHKVCLLSRFTLPLLCGLYECDPPSIARQMCLGSRNLFLASVLA